MLLGYGVNFAVVVVEAMRVCVCFCVCDRYEILQSHSVMYEIGCANNCIRLL